MKRPCLWTAACFAAATMTASAQTPTPAASSKPNEGVDQVRIDQGKVVYAQKCRHCHGPDMVTGGNIAPDLRKFPDNKERFFTVVKLGKNGKMPPWGDLLSDDQIATLWDFAISRRTP